AFGVDLDHDGHVVALEQLEGHRGGHGRLRPRRTRSEQTQAQDDAQEAGGSSRMVHGYKPSVSFTVISCRPDSRVTVTCAFCPADSAAARRSRLAREVTALS